MNFWLLYWLDRNRFGPGQEYKRKVKQQDKRIMLIHDFFSDFSVMNDKIVFCFN